MRFGVIVAVGALLAGCGTWVHRGQGPPYFTGLPLGASHLLPVPAGAPIAPQRVALGRRLFFDTNLARGRSTSCATCHVPDRAFTDGHALAIGDGGAIGRRNSPTLLNRAYGRTQFFDGRAPSLEQQALLPLTNPLELANTHEEIARRLGTDASYRRQFRSAFGNETITIERVATAIASFERTLVAGDSPVDRYLVLRDTSALTPLARRGAALFFGKASCVVCHEPPLFTDDRFHNTGVAWHNGAFADSGRSTISGRREDVGAFKAPTLRNVELTAPYMHDGSLATLEDVIAFYDRGGNANPNLDALLRPLALTPEERSALAAFLRSLTGPRAQPGGSRSRREPRQRKN